MKNGSNRAVLVSELTAHDGPFVDIAEDFVSGRCSRCACKTGEEVHFLADGFLCSACARAVTH